MKRAFTLIELLIVIAIILILVAIALPNFLAAQTRAKVARVESDLRNLATAIEFFRTEHMHYPIGTDNPDAVPLAVKNHFEANGPYGFYTMRTVFSGDAAATLGYPNLPNGTPIGVVPGLTTPVEYIESIPTDPFTTLPGFITYSYREDRADPLEGWIVTSFGPDGDEFENMGQSALGGVSRSGMFLPFVDAQTFGRHGDINERAAHPGSDQSGYPSDMPPRSLLQEAISFVTYSPTNGLRSEGDIVRVGP